MYGCVSEWKGLSVCLCVCEEGTEPRLPSWGSSVSPPHKVINPYKSTEHMGKSILRNYSYYPASC